MALKQSYYYYKNEQLSNLKLCLNTYYKFQKEFKVSGNDSSKYIYNKEFNIPLKKNKEFNIGKYFRGIPNLHMNVI